MDSINTARDFFINQQGLSPDQAEKIISKGMEAYNERIQPQSMMQMASGGRIGYGFGSLVGKASGVVEPVSGGDTSASSGGFGMGIMGRLIQQNPQMFRNIQASSRKDFIDENLNGIDDRQEAAYGGRIGYQMGGSPMGVQAMPMDTGQALQVPQQAPTNFSSAQNITMNPLLNYGQTQLAQGGATPLTMRSGGIARLGYESGGVTLPSQGSELAQSNEMDSQQALETIIKILIENGIPPEQAQQLALQIIQIFAQGGAPAVEAFANQLEQQEAQAMASGGIAGYAYRQGYGFGSFVSSIGKAVTGAVKGVASAVKSVAKSSIGRAALTVAAATFLGPGAFGISGLGLSGLQLGLATALANAGLQKLGGGKFSLLEAGLSGLSAGLGTPGTSESTAANITADGTNLATTNAAYNAQGIGNTTLDTTGFGTDYGPTMGLRTAPPVDELAGARSDIFTLDKANLDTSGAAGKGSQIYNPPVESKPGIFQTLQTKMSDALNSPIQTLKSLGTGAIDLIEEYPKTAAAVGTGIGFGTGYALGAPQGKDESDEDFAKRQQEEVNPLITYYGRNLQIKNPYFYQKFGAVNPFETAAEGGIMGYRNNYGGAGMVSPRSEPNPMAERNDLAIQLFGKPIYQLTPAELDQLENFIREKFGKTTSQEETVFAARGGSMVPPARQIEGGILELDARKSGGYIPYGKKERVDDVPAMLAKDEFVFTSKAVKAAGGGNARRGAAKMYALMKKLEGARA